MERAKRDVILSVSKAPSKTTALIDLDVISIFPTCNIPSRDVIPYFFFSFCFNEVCVVLSYAMAAYFIW